MLRHIEKLPEELKILFSSIYKYTSKQHYFCLEHTSVRRFLDPFSSIQKTNVKPIATLARKDEDVYCGFRPENRR